MQTVELNTRYNRRACLNTAPDALYWDGQAMLRTERLAQDLGRARGSFHHHFKNREAFVAALAEFWANAFTEEVNAHIASQDAPAEVRLLLLMRLIRDKRLDKYDIAFRIWAAQEPAVAQKVHDVDKSCYPFEVALFSEMGFEGDDLEERVRLFLVYESAQHNVWFPDESRHVPDSVERRYEMITGRKPPAV